MDLVHGENIIRSVNESNWKKQTFKGLMRERALIIINNQWRTDPSKGCKLIPTLLFKETQICRRRGKNH